MTFTTSPSLIPVWRTVIKHRYFDGLSQSKYFHSTWADYTRIDGKRVLVDTGEIDGYELSQSALHVHLTTGTPKQQIHDKLITVHIYHTNGKKPSVRIVLVQGYRCPQWVKSEFETVKRRVQEIASKYICQSAMLNAALTANIPMALTLPEEMTQVVSSSVNPPNKAVLPVESSSSDAAPEEETTPNSSSSLATLEEKTTPISSSVDTALRAESTLKSHSSDAVSYTHLTLPTTAEV